MRPTDLIHLLEEKGYTQFLVIGVKPEAEGYETTFATTLPLEKFRQEQIDILRETAKMLEKQQAMAN